ncbi:MAG TPA: aspartyl/asparaginyl beta-hydroxylase domain-containing protein [Pyrinomonadaceae bacterium]|nr:aspartyl/asparaginyl beta-hydroxylase domain-containing protein [Pyrinomonadaceae bacterium]
MISTLRLPLSFDVQRVKDELVNFKTEDWTPHFNTQYYEGDWSGIALRAPANAHVELYPDPTAEQYVDTAALGLCPSVNAILQELKCETESVRFLRLGSGAKIREHRDYKLSIDDGLARVHIPIKTSTEVDFYLDGRRVEMHEGEAWYLNFNLPHHVTNNSGEARVHLVVDCVANDWLRSFFD